MLRKIKIWWKASILDYPYWRVTYEDGNQTRLLYYAEAKSLKEVFKGKIWIDYKVAK